MADTEQLNREDYLPITDSWREEWEKGVQVPVNPDHLPDTTFKILREVDTSEEPFKLPKKLIKVCLIYNEFVKIDSILCFRVVPNQNQSLPSMNQIYKTCVGWKRWPNAIIRHKLVITNWRTPSTNWNSSAPEI